MDSHANNNTIQHIIARTRRQDTTQSSHVVLMSLPATFLKACWPKNHPRWFLVEHVVLLCFHDVLINMTHIFYTISWFFGKHVSPWKRHTCFLRVLMLSLITHDTTCVIAHAFHVHMCHGFHPFTPTHHNQVAYFLYQHIIFVRSRVFPVSCAVIRFICCPK